MSGEGREYAELHSGKEAWITSLRCVALGPRLAPQDIQNLFQFHAQLPDDLLAHGCIGLGLFA